MLHRRWKANNGTFALHVDMMKHCDEITAIALSERLGGNDRFNLLLAAVKSSLSFSTWIQQSYLFVNNP
jgi:hypothetical protein